MFAATRYFARSYFGGIWPSFAGLSIRPVGISQNVEFGTPTFELELNILPVGIEQDIEFGTPEIQVSILAQEILPTGISQTIEFGIPDVWREYFPPLAINVKIVPTTEFQVRSRPTAEPVQFKSIIDKIDSILAATTREPPLKADLIEVKEFAQITTQSTVAPVQFKSLIANTESITATPIGGNEVARSIKIILQKDNTRQLVASAPVTVQTQAIPARGRLDSLSDVDARSEVEGGVPRYETANDTYVVEAGFKDGKPVSRKARHEG